MAGRDENTKWFYKRVMKSKYNIESNLTYEGHAFDYGVRFIVISLLGNYIKVNTKEVEGGTPKETTLRIIEYLKDKKPECFL